MIDQWLLGLDRKLNESWFDGVLAVLAAAVVTAGLRFLIGCL